MFVGERPERRGHRLCRLADLGGDQRIDVPPTAGLLAELHESPVDEPADAFRREVRMAHDRPALRLNQLDRPGRKHGSLDVAEEDQRLLGDVELGRVDLHLRRLRKALDSVLAVDPAQPGVQRRGTRRPDQSVSLVHRT